MDVLNPRPPDVVEGRVISAHTRTARRAVRLTGEHLAVAAMIAVMLVGAVMAASGLIRDLGAGIDHGLVAVGCLVGAAVLVAVVARLAHTGSTSGGVAAPAAMWSSSPSGRLLTGHAHGAGRALLRHEGGHLTAAERLRVRVTSATVGPDSGLVQLHRADVASMSSRDYMAFMKAGGVASGNSVGCSADRANVRAEKGRMRDAGMAPAEIRRVERQADGDARRYGRAGRVEHWADQLGKRGRL